MQAQIPWLHLEAESAERATAKTILYISVINPSHTHTDDAIASSIRALHSCICIDIMRACAQLFKYVLLLQHQRRIRDRWKAAASVGYIAAG